MACNAALDPSDWHADHVEPFSETGRTNVYEMQALCAECNLKKGTKSMAAVALSLKRFAPDFRGYREDQSRLHQATVDAFRRGAREVGIYLHIRGGKSMLIRMLAADLVEMKLAAVGMVVNNRSELRRQIVVPARWHEDLGYLNTTLPRSEPYATAHVKRRNSDGQELGGYWPDDPLANQEYLLSQTIQCLCINSEKVVRWMQSVKYRTGLPALLFLDEAQEYGLDDSEMVDSESRDWLPTIRRFQEEGEALIVTLSGYPFRADGKIPPGFCAYNEEASEFQKWVFGQLLRVEDDGSRVYEKNLIEGTTLSFNIKPIGGDEFMAPMQRGFDTGALAPIYYSPVAHKITLHVGQELVLDNQSLADVDEGLARQLLGRYLEDVKVVDAMMRHFVAELMAKRRAVNTIKGAIFGLADVGGRKNDQHLLLIESRLRAIAPTLKCRLVTNNTEGSAADALLAFNSDEYDVLLLKNVGRVGFDCPRLKVLGDLSTVRSEGKVAQTWLRVSTPYMGIPGTIITPGDKIGDALFDRIVTNNGGNAMTRTADIEIKQRDEAVVETKDRLMVVGDEVQLPTKGNDLAVAMPEETRLVDDYLADYPGYHSFVQRMPPKQRVEFVRQQMEDFGWEPNDYQPAPEAPPAAGPPREPHEFRLSINRLLTKAAHKRAGTQGRFGQLSKDMQKHWTIARKELLKEAKRRAGQPEERELNEVQSIAALETIEGYLRDRTT